MQTTYSTKYVRFLKNYKRIKLMFYTTHKLYHMIKYAFPYITIFVVFDKYLKPYTTNM